MIRLSDSFILAYTKLRVHRVRTGVTVGVSGVLFGLLLAGIFVAQGVFDSVEDFSNEGLGSRSIVQVSKFTTAQFNAYDHQTDEAFIAEVEQYHAQIIAKKVAAAKKHSVTYDPSSDPSPITRDPITKQKRISDAGLMSSYVRDLVIMRAEQDTKPLDIAAFITRYHYRSATVLPDNFWSSRVKGAFEYMQNGIDQAFARDAQAQAAPSSPSPQGLVVLNDTLARPFITSRTFDPQKGELPIVLPYSHAEKLLGYKKLDKDATTQHRLDRLEEVRQRVNEVTASYCYRNPASQQLLATAQAQQQEITQNSGTAGYQAPSLLYELPSPTSCGPVVVKKDTRSSAEKKADANLVAYQKEIGEYRGEPEQYKITLRGVGVSGDMPDVGSFGIGVSQAVSSLLSSWLGFEQWSIPADLLYQVPEQYRPSAVFPSRSKANAGQSFSETARFDTYLVEFSDKQEARDALGRGGFLADQPQDEIYVSPYGNASLMVDELKKWFQTALLWALAVVGGIALVILASLIGRAVADGRRESAVFRAIGAKRGDIAAIYGMYALLLGLRVAVFSLVLGAVIAGVIELLFWQEATLGARYAYAASSTAPAFHLFGVASWYVPLILGSIVGVSLLASIIPIILGARRSPINDMRNE